MIKNKNISFAGVFVAYYFLTSHVEAFGGVRSSMTRMKSMSLQSKKTEQDFLHNIEDNDDKISILNSSGIEYFMVAASVQALSPSYALADESSSVPSFAEQGGKWFFVAYVVVSLLAGFKELFKRAQKSLQDENK